MFVDTNLPSTQELPTHSYQSQVRKIRAELSKKHNNDKACKSLEQLRKSYDEIEQIVAQAPSIDVNCDALIDQCTSIQTDIVDLSAGIDARSTEELLIKLQIWSRFRSDLGTPEMEITSDEALIFSVLKDLRAMSAA